MSLLRASAAVAIVLPLSAATFADSFREGLLALQKGDLPGAVMHLESAASLQPQNARVQVALAQTYRRMGDATKAEVKASKALRLGAGDSVVRTSLGTYYQEAAQALLMQEKFEDAATLLGGVTASALRNAQLELTRGVALYGLRRFEAAADAFLAAIGIAPQDAQPYVFLGKMLDQIPARLPEVTKRFVEFERAHPDDARGYLLHAGALNASGAAPDEAKSLLEKALALDPKSASAHFELGSVLSEMGQYEKAAEELEKAAVLEPNDPVTHYRLSRVYERLNRPAHAQAERDKHRTLINEQNRKR